MARLILFFTLFGGYTLRAECPGNCPSNPQPVQPYYENLSTVKPTGNFYQTQQAVKECGRQYETCTAGNPQMITTCSDALTECINKSQSGLPPGADGN